MGLEKDLNKDLEELKSSQKIIEEKRKQFMEAIKEGFGEKSNELLLELLTLCGKSLQMCNRVLNEKLVPELKDKMGIGEIKVEEKKPLTMIAIPKNPNVH